MSDAAQPTVEDAQVERCPRCLQPVPPKAARCPECGQPTHSMRHLPLIIGAVGLLALVFAMFVMYRSVRNEDSATAPVPIEETAEPQPGLLPDPPPNAPAKQPAKPEKKPPLNEH